MENIFCLSPIDGRYKNKVESLRPILSEYGLIYFRVYVEIEWLKHLAEQKDILEIPEISKKELKILNSIINEFSVNDAKEIKEIESTTNHDVKAVEYFIKRKMSKDDSLNKIKEFVHFACTSEDINNLSYALMLKKSLEVIFIPDINKLYSSIKILMNETKNFPMLSRTHGQSASPTTMGKEIANVLHRLQRQLKILKKIQILGKINGAVGNFNAHIAAYPNLNWPNIAKAFVEKKLSLHYNPLTTQIEPHDYISECLDCISRINTILIDFSRDIWGYISLHYFKQNPVGNEVGSSTMPHKINPIDFENAEGNMGLANAIMRHLSSKLPISRWQRDLTDSTVIRNLGSGIAYCIISYKSIIKGISKLEINEAPMTQDLQNNVEVLSEAIQTVMRRYGIEKPYEKLKALTRGKRISMSDIQKFIDTLELSHSVKIELKKMTASNYIGLAKELCEEMS